MECSNTQQRGNFPHLIDLGFKNSFFSGGVDTYRDINRDIELIDIKYLRQETSKFLRVTSQDMLFEVNTHIVGLGAKVWSISGHTHVEAKGGVSVEGQNLPIVHSNNQTMVPSSFTSMYCLVDVELDFVSETLSESCLLYTSPSPRDS